jgi:hypothetical protein
MKKIQQNSINNNINNININKTSKEVLEHLKTLNNDEVMKKTVETLEEEMWETFISVHPNLKRKIYE